MNNVSLEKVMALNEELAALAAAGVPLDLGDPNETVPNTLSRINSSLALRSSLGQPITSAVAEGQELPSVYQHALLVGLQTDQVSLAFDGVTRQATANNDIRRTVGYSLIQPIIVFGLAYCGFIVLCLLFAPTLEGIYEQMRQAPNAGVQFLATCREWMPVWVPLVPLAVVLTMLAWRWRTNYRRPWLPGSRRYFATIKHAMFAEQAARLLDANVVVPQSLRIAAKAADDADLTSAVETAALAHEQTGPMSPIQVQQLSSLPPFLRWVLTSDLDRESLARMLHFAAETYRQSVDRQSAIWHLLLPTAIGALLGGLIVFAFGLSMFGSYIGLLWDLAL